ncbi:hypothetical protein EVAR_43655_1 [Eumeta japonica]|uniref:Uncharacterized protein n=1 Tax=Eumeta variegata TaxID=151549 RepID=A0A4C1XWC5_EUMVA|nr:hypothetical protein EVAR_43655_1 [Eumeta japonica]
MIFPQYVRNLKTFQSYPSEVDDSAPRLIAIPYVRFSIPQKEWNHCGGKNQIEWPINRPPPAARRAGAAPAKF